MKKRKVSNVMLVIMITAVTLYAAADFALQYFAGVEVSPTLTTCWFAFWGTEIVGLTSIKVAKVIKDNNNKEK